jgi:hypothetical protein
MPHVKMVMLNAIHSANSKLRDAEPGLIAGADTLVALGADLGMSDDDLETIEHLYPELQDVILSSIKTASVHGRPVYLSWRHSAVQRVEVTAPPSSASEGAVDIHIESRYDDDGLGQALYSS